MTRHTSEAIARRVAAMLDADRRRFRAAYCCELLTFDAHKRDLALSFRPDAAGNMHIFEHRDFAFEYAARNTNSLAGWFADSLMRLCGPRLGRLQEVAQSLSASQNSRIRADLRTLEKNLTPRQRSALTKDRQRHLEIEAEFARWRWPEKS